MSSRGIEFTSELPGYARWQVSDDGINWLDFRDAGGPFRPGRSLLPIPDALSAFRFKRMVTTTGDGWGDVVAVSVKSSPEIDIDRKESTQT
jgi:hypothetical protein